MLPIFRYLVIRADWWERAPRVRIFLGRCRLGFCSFRWFWLYSFALLLLRVCKRPSHGQVYTSFLCSYLLAYSSKGAPTILGCCFFCWSRIAGDIGGSFVRWRWLRLRLWLWLWLRLPCFGTLLLGLLADWCKRTPICTTLVSQYRDTSIGGLPSTGSAWAAPPASASAAAASASSAFCFASSSSSSYTNQLCLVCTCVDVRKPSHQSSVRRRLYPTLSR